MSTELMLALAQAHHNKLGVPAGNRSRSGRGGAPIRAGEAYRRTVSGVIGFVSARRRRIVQALSVGAGSGAASPSL